jgi:hypothetical protein
MCDKKLKKEPQNLETWSTKRRTKKPGQKATTPITQNPRPK